MNAAHCASEKRFRIAARTCGLTPNSIITDGARRFGRNAQGELNVHRDKRRGRIVDVPEQFLGDNGNARVFFLRDAGDLPMDSRHILGNSAINFAVELFHDFRPALCPPHFRGVNFFPVLHRTSGSGREYGATFDSSKLAAFGDFGSPSGPRRSVVMWRRSISR